MNQDTQEKNSLYHENYPRFIIFLRLIFLLGVFILCLYIFLDFKKPLAYLYILYAIFCSTLILPLSRCVHCSYYGRFCNTGWGRVSAYLFEKRNQSDYVNKSSFYILTYPLWILPGVLVFFELLFKRSLKYVILFCGFILLWFFGKLFLRWVCCRRCCQKDFCPEVPFK